MASGEFTYRQLEQLWLSAGGRRSLAPTMAAIAEAESGGNPKAENPSGATGLWQILGAVRPADQSHLTSPAVNAREAVLKDNSQGLGAWTTFTSGAYKKFMQGGSTPRNQQVTSGAAFLKEVEKFTGTPYVWGGDSPKGFDCSGLVFYAAEKLGIKNFPRTSEQQWNAVARISQKDLKPGDLVFYAGSDGTAASPGHVAIYAGNGQVVQALETGTDVGKFPMASGGKPVGFGRIPGLTGVTGGSNPVNAQVGPNSGGGGNPIWDAIAGGVLTGGSVITSGLETITGAGPLGAIAAAIVRAEHGVEWFLKPGHWVRIVCFILGVPLVGIGVVTMTKGAQPVPVSAYGVSTEVSAGSISPAIGIAEVTLGAVLLFVAFHNLDADSVTDFPSLVSYLQGNLQRGGAQATTGGG